MTSSLNSLNPPSRLGFEHLFYKSLHWNGPFYQLTASEACRVLLFIKNAGLLFNDKRRNTEMDDHPKTTTNNILNQRTFSSYLLLMIYKDTKVYSKYLAMTHAIFWTVEFCHYSHKYISNRIYCIDSYNKGTTYLFKKLRRSWLFRIYRRPRKFKHPISKVLQWLAW